MSQDKDHNPIADDTWRKGFIHLTVDGLGLVSLWDHPVFESPNGGHGQCTDNPKEGMELVSSYLKLPLTAEQIQMIEETMKKDGYTP